MSIANIKDSGNQGNNMPWQWKMLQGIQAIADATSTPLKCDDEVTVCGTTFTEGSLNTNITNGSVTVDGGTGTQRTPTFLRPAGTDGTVAAGTYSMSFASVGTANATVGGITLKPGETINFDAGAINNTLGAVSYVTSAPAGAELIIITLT